MATKYNIDINDIRPKITNCIKTTDGSGNATERFFVLRVNSVGATHVDYDKVLYELVLSDLNDVEPNGGDFNTSDRATTNKRTHGNGVIDTNLGLSPATFTIPANTSTASTKTGTVTVTQNDGSTEFPGYDGASAKFTWTQAKDYPVSVSLSLETPAVIPASGGDVKSTTYTAKAKMKSGEEVDVTNDTACTIAWTEVTGITSLGTTIKNQAKVGTLKGKATYKCNGKEVSGEDEKDVYQAENKVTGITATCGTFSYTQFTAAGGTATPSTNNANSYKLGFSSTSTSTSDPGATYGTLTTSVAYSMTDGGGFTLNNTTNGEVTAADRGTTIGATRSSNTITKKYVAKWTASDTYPSTEVSDDNSQDTNASQGENKLVSTTWNNPVVSLSYATSTIHASGGTTSNATASATQSGTLTYTSTASAATSYTGAYTWSYTLSSTGTWSIDTNGKVTAPTRGTVTGATDTRTVTAKAVGAGSKEGTKNVNVSQGENNVESTAWNNPVVTAVAFAITAAAGGTASRTTNASATQSGTLKYTSTASAATSNTAFTWTISSDNSAAIISNGTTTTPTLTWAANTSTSLRSATITTKATGAGSKSASNTSTASQNGATPSYTLSISPTSQTGISSAGTAFTITVTANQSWTVAKSDSWITLSTTAGTGDGSVTVTVSKNSTTTARTGTVTFTGGQSGSASCSVGQNAAPSLTFKIDNSTQLQSAGGNSVTYNGKTVTWNDWSVQASGFTINTDTGVSATMRIMFSNNNPTSVTVLFASGAVEFTRTTVSPYQTSASVTITIPGNMLQSGSINVRINQVF